MASTDGYVLGRDPTENERLKWQNTLLINCVGYTLHPTIATRLGTTLHVAEIASGPGTFLHDLAATLDPASRIEGTDISDVAWLSAGEDLPSNVTMSIVDGKKPPDEGRRGTYDLVCIRFMNVAMASEDWAKVAEHAWMLLRPGGALQWMEGDFLQCSPALYTSPGDKTSAANRIYEKSISTYPHFNFFVANLRPLLRKAGFSEVRQEVASSDRKPELRREVSTMAVGAMLSVMRVKQRMKAADAVEEEELEALRKEAMAEYDAGAYLRFDMHTFVAFKG